MLKDTELILEGRGIYGELSNKKNFDPADPEVIVKGVGVYKLSALKKNIQEKIADLVKKAEADDFHFLDWAIAPKGILAHFIKAVLEVEKELESPAIKRKLSLANSKNEEKWSEKKSKKQLKEIAPPDKDIERWIRANKDRFKKEYGVERGLEILYRTAWKNYDKKQKK